jgi:L-alanine-DL-glutamate epimerase-like enolase superfamily enzyme
MSGTRHLYGISDVAIGIIDVALWDIVGKVAGLSVGAMLGIDAPRLPTYRTLSRFQLATPEDVARTVPPAAVGVHGVKIQVWDGPDRDIPRLEQARELAGPGVTLMHDAAGQYDLWSAMRVGAALADLQYHWFEEPIPDAEVANLARLRSTLTVPIVAAETASLRQLPEYLAAGAVDALRGDVLIKGGITGLRKAVALAELHGVRLEIHTGGAPLLDLANLHVAASTRVSTFVETHHEVFRFGLREPLLEPDAEGYLRVPTGPGLGAELDWDWIEDHTVGVVTPP